MTLSLLIPLAFVIAILAYFHISPHRKRRQNLNNAESDWKRLMEEEKSYPGGRDFKLGDKSEYPSCSGSSEDKQKHLATYESLSLMRW
jgi:hypothetical protein